MAEADVDRSLDERIRMLTQRVDALEQRDSIAADDVRASLRERDEARREAAAARRGAARSAEAHDSLRERDERATAHLSAHESLRERFNDVFNQIERLTRERDEARREAAATRHEMANLRDSDEAVRYADRLDTARRLAERDLDNARRDVRRLHDAASFMLYGDHADNDAAAAARSGLAYVLDSIEQAMPDAG